VRAFQIEVGRETGIAQGVTTGEGVMEGMSSMAENRNETGWPLSPKGKGRPGSERAAAAAAAAAYGVRGAALAALRRAKPLGMRRGVGAPHAKSLHRITLGTTGE
jgi:hypothetical protein